MYFWRIRTTYCQNKWNIRGQLYPNSLYFKLSMKINNQFDNTMHNVCYISNIYHFAHANVFFKRTINHHKIQFLWTNIHLIFGLNTPRIVSGVGNVTPLQRGLLPGAHRKRNARPPPWLSQIIVPFATRSDHAPLLASFRLPATNQRV